MTVKGELVWAVDGLEGWMQRASRGALAGSASQSQCS